MNIEQQTVKINILETAHKWEDACPHYLFNTSK